MHVFTGVYILENMRRRRENGGKCKRKRKKGEK
jgi:hypothetical protein